MAAARGDGSAYVMTGARYGLFTEHLIAGLRGAAGGADGLVRVLDLYHYVQRNMVDRCPAQRPVLKTELEDNYPVALFQAARRVLDAPSPPKEFTYDVLVIHASSDRDLPPHRVLQRSGDGPEAPPADCQWAAPHRPQTGQWAAPHCIAVADGLR